MKKALSLVLVLVINGCATSPEQQRYDQLLVGEWEGSRTHDIGCQFFSWKTRRSPNGEYSIRFYSDEEKTILIGMEEGTWWTNGNMFIEKNNSNMKDPDVYTYKLIGGSVRFTNMSSDASSDCPTSDYEFTDYKVN